MYATPDLNDSPFDNVHLPDTNEAHVQPTTENILFALSEIRQVPLGINDTSANSRFQLTQNPVSNETINIRFGATNTSNSFVIKIYNYLGQLISKKNMQTTSNELSVAHQLSAGMYFIQVEDDKGSQTLKFIVK